MTRNIRSWLSVFWRRIFHGKEKLQKLHRGRAKFYARYEKYNYRMGQGSYGLPVVHDWHEGSSLSIGAFTSIADDVHIFLGGHHRIDWISSFPFPAFMPEISHIENYGGTKGDVVIGNDVWLASGCTILSGVTVGDGAVVAARAVVTKSVAPFSIVGGNPAQVIGWRFDEKTRTMLLDAAWWAWSENEIRQVVPLLCSTDFEQFRAYLAKRQVSGFSSV